MELIEKSELKSLIEYWFERHKRYHPYSKNNDISIPELYDILEQVPSIDAVPVKHGEWEFAYEDTNEELIFECSLCKGFSTRDNFCPHCGAMMDGEE